MEGNLCETEISCSFSDLITYTFEAVHVKGRYLQTLLELSCRKFLVELAKINSNMSRIRRITIRRGRERERVRIIDDHANDFKGG